MGDSDARTAYDLALALADGPGVDAGTAVSVQNSLSNRHSPYWIASVACTPQFP